eukprot:3007984-Karenia_brevis.AAC.1
MKQWHVAEKIPTLVFVGDKFQLPGMGQERPWHHPAWNKECKHIDLRTVWRVKDTTFNKWLTTIRENIPDTALLNNLCRGHKVWNTPKLT